MVAMDVLLIAPHRPAPWRAPHWARLLPTSLQLLNLHLQSLYQRILVHLLGGLRGDLEPFDVRSEVECTHALLQIRQSRAQGPNHGRLRIATQGIGRQLGAPELEHAAVAVRRGLLGGNSKARLPRNGGRLRRTGRRLQASVGRLPLRRRVTRALDAVREPHERLVDERELLEAVARHFRGLLVLASGKVHEDDLRGHDGVVRPAALLLL